jgi:hypothetical protein
MRRALILVLVVTTLALSAQAGAQEPPACLGNNYEYTVAVGAQYTDEQGLWTCDPASADATAGGWVLTAAPSPTPEPTSTATAPATAASGGGAGVGLNAFVVALAMVCGITVITTALYLWRRRMEGALTGTLSTREVHRGGS